jgi:hypothetical protein
MNPDIQIIIDRLKSHPEDFFETVEASISANIRSPRLEYLERMMRREFAPRREDEVRPKVETRDLWFLTDDERAALRNAYIEAVRNRFTASVVFNIMRPDTEVETETLKYRASGRYAQQLGASMMNTKNVAAGAIMGGFSDPRATFGSAPVKAEGSSVDYLDSSGVTISAAQTPPWYYNSDSNGT